MVMFAVRFHYIFLNFSYELNISDQPPMLSTPSKGNYNFFLEFRILTLYHIFLFLERCWLWLTAQTCHFARNIVPFSRDIAQLRLYSHINACDAAISQIWQLQLDYFDKAVGVQHEV